MGHPVLRARRDYKLSSLEELLSLIIINIIVWGWEYNDVTGITIKLYFSAYSSNFPV